MADRQDFVALAWVKGPIDECLVQARQALEHFADGSAEGEWPGVFIDSLHQVLGCLVILELRGAALLVEETTLLARALADGRVANRNETQGTLFRALAQLPLYLERLRGARRDLPLLALPLLNQLRAARGAEALDDGVLGGAPLAGEHFELPLDALQGQLSAMPDRDALRSVVTAVREDLNRIK